MTNIDELVWRIIRGGLLCTAKKDENGNVVVTELGTVNGGNNYFVRKEELHRISEVSTMIFTFPPVCPNPPKGEDNGSEINL